jgi:carboxyl-terminal processing protease
MNQDRPLLGSSRPTLFSMGAGFLAGLLFACSWLGAYTPSDKISPHAEPHFRLMAEAWNTIERHFVERSTVKPMNLTYGAISGMVDALGDAEHSRFLTPEMVIQEKNYAQGKLEGIGAEVQKKNNQLVIVAPMDGSPAQRAGLKPGDVILKVNEEPISDLPLDMAVGRILGPAGSSVALTILDAKTKEMRIVTLIRSKIVLHNVTWQRLPGVSLAHIRIAGFSHGVTQDLKKVLRTVREEQFAGLILDLRNNPGGLLEEAIGTASQFLEGGDVVLIKDAQGNIGPVPVGPGGLATRIPMAVLINGGTASAPEIIAGALQDARRATLIGEKTFGTGTVLQSFPLSDGSALLLAVEEWLTPSGRTIWHKGIMPDLAVALPPDGKPIIPGVEKELTAADLQSGRDTQLLQAVQWLSSPQAAGTQLPRDRRGRPLLEHPPL